MAPMAKKKKSMDAKEIVPIQSPEPSVRDGTNFNFWLEDEVSAAIDKYRQAQDVLPSKTGLFRSAIIEFLSKRGYWPPKPDSGK